MITWLFTQVWLWSLAAFALGALITWLLFVRPLQRRLVETAAYPEGDYEFAQAIGYDEEQIGEAPLDLLRPAPQRWESADEPPVGDWGRDPQAWAPPEQARPARPDANSTWFREWDEKVNGSSRDDSEAAATAVPSRMPPAEQQPPAKSAALKSAVAKPALAEPQAPVGSRGAAESRATGANAPAQAAPAESTTAESTTAQSPATASTAAGAPAVQPPAVKPKAQSDSSTTVKPKAVTGEDQPTEFTAAMWPTAEPDTTESSKAPASSPEQVVAAITAEAAAEPAASAKAAEPAKPAARQAGAERPEAPTAQRADAGKLAGRLEGADDATESRLSGQLRSLFEEVEPQGASGAAATPYPPPVGAEATEVIPKVEDGKAAEPPPLPRRTPGAGPRPGKEGGSGPMIKGHSASRQYHSPDSPAYDKIVADVWFRTPVDAEIAGFQPWNGQRAT